MRDSARKAIFAKINRDRVDNITKDEIVLTTTNDGEFYRRTILPNVKNIEKRMKRNDFKKNYLLTKKSFIDSLGKQAIDRYEEEFGTPENKMRIDVDTKRAIGEELAEKIMDEARDNIRIDVSEKRQFLVKRKHDYPEEYQKRNKDIELSMRSF